MGTYTRLDGTVEIIPLKKPVSATVQVPGSKSYTNRALIMAALTPGPVVLQNPLYSEDTEAMVGCLQTLGLQIATKPDQIIVQGDMRCVEDKHYELFARDSGTTARFLLALLCTVPGVKILQGNPRLNERPIGDLVDALRALGARIEYGDREGGLPVKITSSTLSGTCVHLKGDRSSQFISALLLIAPALSQGLTLHVTGSPLSKPYIDMTVRCMEEGGVKVDMLENGRYEIPAHSSYQKKQYLIEGDYSSAGYFFAIAALTQSTLVVENLNPHSVQPDRKFLEILARMGNPVTLRENGVCIEGKQILSLDVAMEDCPDQVMTMAVLAAFAKGVTRIAGVRSLRDKETERVFALKKELGKMGIRTEDTRDTLTIYGGSPRAATIATYNDHRMAMAFAVAGLHVPGTVICHPEVVKKTFPNFWDVLRSVG
jgi:3-phosphoshikimate 1-carboxyvinyltransferase